MPPTDSTPAACKRKLHLTCDLYPAVLIVIFLLTAINGFYNSLNTEYGRAHTTFLFTPGDRHGDLLKAALSFPPDRPIAHPEQIPSTLLSHPYQGLSGVDQGKLTDLHAPPLDILYFLGVKQLLIRFGPTRVIELYYALSLIAVVWLAAKFSRNLREGFLVGGVLLLSYPFLMVLSRGNAPALLTSLALIFCIYELLVRRRGIAAALAFALAFNCRPNILLLAPIFLVLEWRALLRAALVFGIAAPLLFGVSYLLSIHLYEGYNFAVFQKALAIYYQKYVLGILGEPYNNSLYGVFHPLVTMLNLQPGAQDRALHLLLWMITFGAALSILGFACLYLRRQIDAYAYIFAIGSLYVLGSSVLATYHLFFLFIFILLLAIPKAFDAKADIRDVHLWIIGTTAFLLVPKDYLFHHGISFEIIANPLVLSLCLLAIFRSRRSVAEAVSLKALWESLTGARP